MAEKRKARILVVDDEPRGVELLSRTLRKIGTVEVATSADAAWDLVRKVDYDVVISDQRMPGVTGVELLSRIADSRPHIGRILFTGYTEVAATEDAFNKGRIHAYVSKPCPPAQLQFIVESVIERIEFEQANVALLEELGAKNAELEEVLARLRGEQKSMVEAARQAALNERVAASRSAVGSALTSLQTISDVLAAGKAIPAARARELASQVVEALEQLGVEAGKG